MALRPSTCGKEGEDGEDADDEEDEEDGDNADASSSRHIGPSHGAASDSSDEEGAHKPSYGPRGKIA